MTAKRAAKTAAVIMTVGVAAVLLGGARDFAYGRVHEAACDGKLTELRLWLILPLDLERNLPGRLAPLICAAMHGRAEAAKILLAHGANPNVTGKLGITPLESAAYYGKTEVASTLIQAGADVNLPGEDGRPLAVAVAECHPTAAELLLRAGANADLSYGTRTIREYAMRKGCSAVKEIFRTLPPPKQ